MKLRTVIYLFLVAILLVGCGGRISMRQLEQLESRVNDMPDSVLTVLTAADMPCWGEARALYALLTVQAQDKSYIDVADDSLISVATRYYERKGQALRRLQAFYYHGRVHVNAGRRHEAMTSYSRAMEFVDEVDSPYPVGLLYAQMGVLYGQDYDYPKALAYMEEALHYYELADKEQLQNFTKLDIGQIHLNMCHFLLANPLLNEVLTWGETNEDSSIIASSLYLLLRLYDATGEISKIDALLSKYPIETKSSNATIHGIVAHYYARKNDVDKAKIALAHAWDAALTTKDTAILWQKSYQIYKDLNEPDEALYYHEALFTLQDSVVRTTLQQPLIVSQLEHYQSQLEIEELRNLNYRYLTGGVMLVVLVIAVTLWFLYRERFRKKNEQVMHYMNVAEQLRSTLYNKEEELGKITDELQQHTADTDTLQQRIAHLFKEQYTLLNELCTVYYENPHDKQRRESIFHRVSKAIDSFSSDEGYAHLETIVNDCRNGVIDLLRSELPKFKETDYRLLCYFCAGLSVQAISVFTKIETEKLWVYKSRLIARITKSDAPNKEVILSQIPHRVRKSSQSGENT